MQRNKVEMKKWPNENNKDRENMLTNIPTIFRAEEKYICPQEPYWEERYYNCLLKITHITTKHLQN